MSAVGGPIANRVGAAAARTVAAGTARLFAAWCTGSPLPGAADRRCEGVADLGACRARVSQSMLFTDRVTAALSGLSDEDPGLPERVGQSMTRDENAAGGAGQVTSGREPAGNGVPFDTSRAHMARVYDFWLGGKDNFAADRVVAERVAAAYPDVLVAVRAQRAFLARAVHFLVAEAGIRQFLDIGTGLPSANNTHQVAQAAAPQSRVVYVDNDPIVLSHGQALLTSSPDGATAYIDADLRDAATIAEQAAGVLDFRQPVAVMLLGILQGIPDQDQPGVIIARLMDAVVPGSYLAISQIAGDVAVHEVAEGVQRHNEQAAVSVAARTHTEVCRFFAGLDLLEPGVVQVHRWRPGAGDVGSGRDLAIYAGVGRKP